MSAEGNARIACMGVARKDLSDVGLLDPWGQRKVERP